MSIEIRQLVVNAKVQDPQAAAGTDKDNHIDLERLKDQIMAACREMIRHMHKQHQER